MEDHYDIVLKNKLGYLFNYKGSLFPPLYYFLLC